MSLSSHPVATPEAGASEDHTREAAERYVEQLRVFYTHAAVFAVSMIVIFVVNLMVNIGAGLTGEWWAWWSGWVLIGWGLGVAIHGIVVRLSRPRSSSSAWAERKVDEIVAEANTKPSR